MTLCYIYIHFNISLIFYYFHQEQMMLQETGSHLSCGLPFCLEAGVILSAPDNLRLQIMVK